MNQAIFAGIVAFVWVGIFVLILRLFRFCEPEKKQEAPDIDWPDTEFFPLEELQPVRLFQIDLTAEKCADCVHSVPSAAYPMRTCTFLHELVYPSESCALGVKPNRLDNEGGKA